MIKNTTIQTIAIIFIASFLLQLLLINSDLNDDSPGLAALEFSKNYFKVDKKMENRLCSDRIMPASENVVDKYISTKTEDALERGLSVFYLKDKLYNVQVTPLEKNKQTAKIKLHFEKKPALKSFFTKQKRKKVNATLELKKENGKWKVCGEKIFDLPEA